MSAKIDAPLASHSLIAFQNNIANIWAGVLVVGYQDIGIEMS